MSTFCECDSSHKNMGVKNCPIVVKTKKKDFFVPITASDGTRNSIKESDFVDGILPDSFITDKLNEADPSKRWYPTPDKYEQVTPGRTDDITEELNSGRVIRLEGGVRNFEGDIMEQDSTLATKILSFGCGEFGTYEVFADGALRGERSNDGTEDVLYPLMIESGSLQSYDVETVEGSAAQRIKVIYQFSRFVNEANFMVILGSNIGTDLLKVNGLLDGTINVLDTPAITNATVSANVTYNCYGSFGVDSYIQGLDVVADWELLDGVTPIVIASVDDLNSDGSQLDFTYTSTPTTDLTLNYIGTPTTAVMQGFDIPSVTFTTPA